MNKLRHRLLIACLLGLVAFTVWQWGQAVTIHLKAQFAQYLIAASWHRARLEPDMPGRLYTPWPWADTWPVARLQWRKNIDLFVLAGTDGSTLAFGPGHMHDSAPPGEGTAVLAGHRDTHFRFLEHVQLGDDIRVQDRRGRWLLYRVTGTQVVNADETVLDADFAADRLVLVTCFPFDAIAPGGPLRYLVVADRLPSNEA